MRKVLALILVLPLLSSVVTEQPAHAWKTPKIIREADVTNKNSGIRKVGPRVDPTNPNSAGGRFVKKAVPVSCAVAGAVAASPATLTAAGVVVTAGAATVAHSGCYKIVEEAQKK
ncbi:MAG: hypothetical protein KME46_28590 [Brasilonema angustatum HA4187-MV1]|jgi:hypothetical protein|nr:hypothetical protein [Brasilonema angustatum HA4187-MV1]